MVIIGQMLPDRCLWVPLLRKFKFLFSVLAFFFLKKKQPKFYKAFVGDISLQLLKLPSFTHSQHVSDFLHDFMHWLLAALTHESICGDRIFPEKQIDCVFHYLWFSLMSQSTCFLLSACILCF